MELRSLARVRFGLARIVVALALGVALIGQVAAPALALGGLSGTINGTVTDPATGKALSGVAVTAVSPATTAKATTDSNGFYSMIGVPVDTYTISFQKTGYQSIAILGVTVQGDQTVTVDAPIQRSLVTIGRVTARAPSAAFQPKQTVDSYQISGTQQQTALGRQFNVSQTQLMQSLPSIVNTVYGSSSIRGSTRTELAYQLEGIDYTDPLSSQFQNSLGINGGVQALQVNPGAGDASQGNGGGGTVNLIIKRGARPAFGSVDFEMLGGTANPYNHQFAFEYGWATPNGRFSNYTSFLGANQYRTYGMSGRPAALQGTFFAPDLVVTRDLINNLVYKFGRDNSQSLQLLYQTRYSTFYQNHGGIAGLFFKSADPQVLGTVAPSVASPTTVAGNATLTGALMTGTYWFGGSSAPNGSRNADFLQIVGLLPSQSNVIQPLYYPGYQPQPVDSLKLEWDSTWPGGWYSAMRIYRVIGSAVFDRPYDSTSPFSDRLNLAQGGWRNGVNGDIQKQVGDKNLVSLSYLFSMNEGVFNYVQRMQAFRSLTPNLNSTGLPATTCPNNVGVTGFSAFFGGPPGFCVGGYEIADFITPGVPVTMPNGSSTNTFCPVIDPLGFPIVPSAQAPNRCGYLAQFFGGISPRIPNIQLPSSGLQQTFGFGLRDQITATNRLKFDVGVRIDGANYHPVGMANTLDFAQGNFTNAVLHPTVVEPRAAVAFQWSNNDAIRFSYGRSTELPVPGIANEPVAYPVGYANIPSYDNRTGMPATYCGPLQNKTCANYAQQLHDEYVNWFNGPEAFAVKPATYNNYDFSIEHQFGGNVGLKITPFFKRGYDVNVFSATQIATDPITGLPIFGPFLLRNTGVDKTTGVEFYLTRDVPYGLGGFLSLTYVNRLQNIPPGFFGQTEDFYPAAPSQSLAIGTLYRAGYLSPLSGRLGVQYKTRGGFRVNPIFTYDKGYPIGAGLTAPVFLNGVATTIPQTNASAPGFGPIALGGAPSTSSQFISPTNPGSLFKPNVVATRGTPESSSAGGVLTHSRMFTDVVLEYNIPNSRSTFGVYVANLWNNIWSEPVLNVRWQPVATGVPGPQTGQTTGTFFNLPGFANWDPLMRGQSPWRFGDTAQPLSFRFYYQLAL